MKLKILICLLLTISFSSPITNTTKIRLTNIAEKACLAVGTAGLILTAYILAELGENDTVPDKIYSHNAADVVVSAGSDAISSIAGIFTSLATGSISVSFILAGYALNQKKSKLEILEEKKV